MTKCNKALILIHGFGSSGDEFLSLFKNKFADLENITIHSLDAPNPCDLMIGKKQWFKLSNLESYLSKEIEHSAKYIEGLCQNGNLENVNQSSEIILMGHSQGSMISTKLAIRNKINIKRVIAFSGMLPFSIDEVEESKTKISFIHGINDNMIKIQRIKDDVERMKQKGFDAELFEIDEMKHEINAEAINLSLSLLDLFGSQIG